MCAEELHCVYCLQRITVDDDAQRVSKSEFAHTHCAFAVNDAFFSKVDDVESETCNAD